MNVNRNYFISKREREGMISLTAITFIEENALLSATQVDDAKKSLQALFLRASGEETMLRRLIEMLKATRQIQNSFANISGTIAGVSRCIAVLEEKLVDLRAGLALKPVTPEANAAFVGPFLEFFTRHSRPSGAFLVLLFILIFKLGDNLASHMTIPFYLSIGFSNTEIGAVAKAFGLIPLFIGIFLGGVLNLRIGLYRTLLIAGVLQGISTLGFAVLAMVGYDLGWLAAVIAFENSTQGMGTAAIVAFMAFLTDTRFTASQFALLSALAALPRVLLTAPTGWLATQLGWVSFFVFAALVAIPGLILLLRFRSWFGLHTAASASVPSSP